MKHFRHIRGAIFNADETIILSWGDDKIVRLWNAKNGSLINKIEHNDYVFRALFNKDETIILSWTKDSHIRLWNTNNGSFVTEMKYGRLYGASFNKDSSLTLSWGIYWDWLISIKELELVEADSIIIWNAKDGVPAADFMKHDGDVNGALFNHDETRILSWSDDKTVRLWNIAADYDFPNEHLPLLVNVMTVTQMDDYGYVTALNKAEWEKQKKEYIKIAKEHLKTCKYKEANLYLKQRKYWGDD